MRFYFIMSRYHSLPVCCSLSLSVRQQRGNFFHYPHTYHATLSLALFFSLSFYTNKIRGGGGEFKRCPFKKRRATERKTQQVERGNRCERNIFLFPFPKLQITAIIFLCVRMNNSCCTWNFFPCWNALSLTRTSLALSPPSRRLMDEMCSPCADECWATLCVFFIVALKEYLKDVCWRQIVCLCVFDVVVVSGIRVRAEKGS